MRTNVKEMNCVVVFLNTILNSWVNEHANLPLRLPVNGCVCRVGSKGFSKSLPSSILYGFLSCGCFFANFLALLKYDGEYLIFRFMKDGVYSVLYGFEGYCRFTFGFKHPLFKCLAFFFFFKKMLDIFSHRFKFLFREFCEYFVNIRYLQCFHVTNNKE